MSYAGRSGPRTARDSGSRARRPNIVFLMADDHQAMAMGCAGNRDIATPNLDALAADGLRFERCYATSPLCMPSRATVFTGLNEYRHGVNFKPNSQSVTAAMTADTWDRYSYAPLLREAGYRTGFAGKWGFPLGKSGYEHDFDAWGGFAGHSQGSYDTAENAALAHYADEQPHVTRALGAFGRDFIREVEHDDRPFCLSVSFKAPHTPHDNIDPADRTLYDGIAFSRRENWGREKAMLLPPQARLGRQYYLFHEWDETHYDDHLRAYYRLISGIDAVVGRLRDELERAGVAQDTVIIYTSDNGYYCGSHGLGGKVLPHEESSRVPLIVMDPRSDSGDAGRVSQAIVGSIDFAPTILAFAGLDPVADADGTSLLPLVNGSGSRVRESLPLIANWGWAEDDRARSMAVVTEEAKYTYWCYGDEHVRPAEELYDLRRDPLELENIASPEQGGALLEKMRRLYDEHHREWSERCVESEDYTRHRLLFDRRADWTEKSYRGLSNPDRAREVLSRLYEEETSRGGDQGEHP
jgi:arylsulfatase A-like enzyme